MDSWKFFSLEVSSQQLALLGKETKDQFIFEVETLAAVIAYILWAPLLKSQFCLIYIDNEGMKFSLMKGFSENPCACKLVLRFA